MIESKFDLKNNYSEREYGCIPHGTVYLNKINELFNSKDYKICLRWWIPSGLNIDAISGLESVLGRLGHINICNTYEVTDFYINAVFGNGDGSHVTSIDFRVDSTYAVLFCDTLEQAEKIKIHLNEYIEKNKSSVLNNKNNINFTYVYRDEVRTLRREIDRIRWTDIKGNYTGDVNRAVSYILNRDITELGKVIVWHGEPGTGKTYAIRALISELSCSLNYDIETNIILDPNVFLDNPFYYYALHRDSSVVSAGGTDRPQRKRLNLFILEDCASVIMQEAQSSKFLRSFLNMTDGFLSQNEKDVFLVTFNEDVTKIDPAVLRPGRCIQKCEFTGLSTEECNEWLKAREINQTVNTSKTIADLYGIHRGAVDYQDNYKSLGFGAK